MEEIDRKSPWDPRCRVPARNRGPGPPLGGLGVCVLSYGEGVWVCTARPHTRSLCQRRVPNTFSFLAIRLRLRKPLP